MKKKNFIPAFGKAGKMGTYTIVMAAILLAAIVIVNVIVSMLPSKYTKLDTSSNKIYTLSDSSVEFVSALDEKVTLYYIVQNGTENTLVDTFLGRYKDLTSNITIVTVDPISEPTFLEDHNAADASNYSVIAVSDKRSKLVDYNDLYYYYGEDSGETLSVDEYEYYYSYYGSYFEYYFGSFSEYFDGDSAITGAIEYVTVDEVPTVYTLEGHSEADLSEVVTTNLFDYSEISYDTLNIALEEKTIPEDADVIVINNPASDITADEATKLNEYLDNGGKILLITSATGATFENLSKVTAHMGMESVPSLVYEGDKSGYTQSQLLLIPTVNSDHDATSVFATSGYSAIVPYAHGIESLGTEDVTFTSLLYTSEKAYTADSDEKKSYTVAAAAEKGEGKMIWIASNNMLTDTYIYGSNGGNYYVLSTMFSWMQDEYSSTLPTIAGIDLSTTYLTVPEGSADFWGAILVVIVPGVILAGGLIYWLIRRKK